MLPQIPLADDLANLNQSRSAEVHDFRDTQFTQFTQFTLGFL